MNMLVKKICLIISICLYIINLFCPVYSFINKDVLSVYDGIPKIYLVGNIDDMNDKKDERKVSINYISDGISFAKFAKIKIQGSSSLRYEKKNYTIKLYNDENLEDSFKVDFGWGKENKYVLKANWIDKTHSRNIVTANIFADIQKEFNLFNDSPNNGMIDGFPIEIYLNNSFFGIYTLNIPKDEWLFNMDNNNPNNLIFSANTWEKTVSFYDKANYIDWEIEVGEQNKENLDKLNRLIDFVMYSSDEDFKKDINDYFNLDSLLNYYIMVETSHLIDNTSKNLLLITYDGNIWYTSLYDLDTSWGTYWNGIDLVNYSETNILLENNLWKRVKDNFTDELVERYFYLRGSILTKGNIMNEFYSFYNLIPEDSFNNELKKWGFIPGYELKQIEEFLDIKLPVLDDEFFSMYTKSNVFVRLFEQKHFT